MRVLKLVSMLCAPVILAAGWAAAEKPETEAPDSGGGEKSAGNRMLGYWAIDLEDKAMVKMMDELAGMLASLELGDGPVAAEAKAAARQEVEDVLGVSSLEFRKGEVIIYGPDGLQKSAYTIKSQDAGTGTFELEMTMWDDTEKQPGRAVLKDDRLEFTTGEGEDMELMVLERIDAAEFKQRKVAAAKMSGEDGEEAGLEDDAAGAGAGPPANGGGAYPVAVAVPGKPGFVFSPYNNGIVDVRAIPSGTLVSDPGFPAEEKKYFRVP